MEGRSPERRQGLPKYPSETPVAGEAGGEDEKMEVSQESSAPAPPCPFSQVLISPYLSTGKAGWWAGSPACVPLRGLFLFPCGVSYFLMSILGTRGNELAVTVDPVSGTPRI